MSGEIRLEVWIDASPETVFAFLTDPVQMQTWLADLVEADARRGGIFRISEPTGASIEGTYQEVVANRKVVFTWGGIEGVEVGGSTVEFTLEPVGKGTLVRLHHYGLPDHAVESHRHGWVQSGIIKLKDATEGRPPARRCLADLTDRSAS